MGPLRVPLALATRRAPANGVERGLDRPEVDAEALLVALVLVPRSYPRNRFFALYRVPEARRARRRASMLRSLVADLAAQPSAVELARRGERWRLRFWLEGVGVSRTADLTVDELPLVKLALDRTSARLDSPDGTLAAAFALVDPAAVTRTTELLTRLLRESE